MKKILFFLPSLNAGGAERVAINIIKLLDSLKKFEIHLLLLEKSSEYIAQLPVDVIVYDLKTKKTIFSILKLRKRILKIRPHIVFSTLIRTHIAIDLALVGIKNKPEVIYRSPNSPKLLLKYRQLSFLRKYLLERAYRNANKIIAQTPEMKDEIIKYHNIKAEKIKVFLNPIDQDLIDKSIKNIENPFNADFINVVAAGRLAEQKGFDVLIKSFRKVIDFNSKFRLFIIGQDMLNEKENLKKIIVSLNLENKISFLGFQENPYRYFYYSDLYVLSSRWEGLPNTVLENLYLKKPVVATKCIPFMNTLIEDGKNGLLVDVESEESLANALLEYEIIDVEFKTITFDTAEISQIFQHEEEKNV